MDQLPYTKVVVGVSGGVDSMTLATLLHKLGYEIIIAHLNHGLRGAESDEDEKFVREFAQRLGVPFISKKVTLPPEGNMENNARKFRYAFLEEVRRTFSADAVAVGHHLDDQLETILMHQKRGAGLRGLRGMQVKNGYLIRPLLEATREDILEYAKEEGVEWREDSSNLDVGLTRNKIRHQKIPAALQKKLLKLSAEATKKLEKLTPLGVQWIEKNVVLYSFERKAFSKLKSDLQAEVLIQLLGPKDLYEKQIKSLIDFIKKGKNGKRMTVKTQTFILEYDRVRWGQEKSTKIVEKKTVTPEGVSWGAWTIKSSLDKPVFVRSWQSGDRFKPMGMTGTKKLQDFFVDAKIPKAEREHIPVIVDENDHILSVGNYRWADGTESLRDKIDIFKK